MRNEGHVSQTSLAAEEHTRKELEVILWREETLWMQKARVDWTLQGDRNTRYFHTTTLRRRHHNRIRGLKNEAGEWILDPKELQDIARSFFVSLFSAGQTQDVALDELFHVRLSEDERDRVSACLSNSDVYSALKGMGRLKSPGKDGFNPLFFQKCWSTVGSDFTRFVVNCFRNPELIPAVNDTSIVLIPKVSQPTSMSQFRPISLCSVIYKALTKCLANRIRGLMKKLIGVNQTSFVLGRQISENIIILQEVVHSMRLKTGRKGVFAIKLDLAKAYDRIEWKFVEETLRRANFPENFISVTMSCISSATTQVLWNGALTEPFTPGRGLRQGCPLSPYLFTLCVERLSNLIMDSTNAGSWQPITLCRAGPGLSHLFFADDLILFGHASIAQCKVIKTCLSKFCRASGQMISNEKSRIFFSRNVSTSSRRSICAELEFGETHNLGRYLGVPVLHGRVTKHTYQFVLDRIDPKLAGWKCKSLSLAGRVTLAVSVLNVIPSYVMQTSVIPMDICGKIDQRIRNFVWGSLPDSRKPHLIS
ncbi:LINE-1 retrotransposable element ORF2 protein [Linum grandiflorum]